MSEDNPLQPKPVPTPPPGLGNIPANQLPGPGRPPMKTGDVAMSDYTRMQLEKLGWNPGDPIPGDLGLRIQEIQAEIRDDDEKLENSELAAGWKPPKPNFVDIDDLPPEHQAELQQYLQEYKHEVTEQKAMASQRDAADAQIPDNVQGPMRDMARDQMLQGEAAMARRQSIQPQSEVIDDRVSAGGPPLSVDVPDGKVFAGSIGKPSVAQKIDDAKRQQAAAAQPKPAAAAAPQPASEEPAPSGAMAAAAPHNCPRCLWPLSETFDLKPTTEDKQGFLAAILGTARFQKKYPMLGGQVVIYYRSLTTEETATVQHQLGCDIRNGLIHGDGEFLNWLMEYRLVASVSQIDVGSNTVARIKSINDWVEDHPLPAKKPSVPPASDGATEALPQEAFNSFGAGLQRPDTPLPRMRDWFYKEIVTQEPLRRIIGQQHREFQRLVEALEAMTSNSSFWKGIGLPAS